MDNLILYSNEFERALTSLDKHYDESIIHETVSGQIFNLMLKHFVYL